MAASLRLASNTDGFPLISGGAAPRCSDIKAIGPESADFC
jgi:hypothetical protein